MPVEISSLIGQTIQAVIAFPGELVHPAWADELTTPIVTMAAFLELQEGGLIRVLACEVPVEGKYPVLGLSFEPCGAESLQVGYPSGHVAHAVPLPEAAPLLPAHIVSVTESDVLGEGCTSQCILTLEGGGGILFRHIMPPETLGISIESSGQAPNSSFKPTPFRGSCTSGTAG